jgi:2-dehydro-3-deoxyphosphogluconate aldolase / (4S)-4-hydroxy-2-oxoglutarate aldolase
MRPADRTARLHALLRANRIIPVITIDRAADAVPLARALVAGGVKALEITLRTPAAVEGARAILAEVPDAIVGLGTVLSPADLELCAQLGVAFAVSPGATRRLLVAADGSNIPLLPGVATASDLMLALDHGVDTVKLFPAVAVGGIATLKALAGPFPQVRFCPTGGITETTAPEWLRQPNVLAIGGSWLCPPDKIRAGDWAGITAIARTAAILAAV